MSCHQFLQMSSSEFLFFFAHSELQKKISKFNQEIEIFFFNHKQSKSLKVKSRVLNNVFINEVK